MSVWKNGGERFTHGSGRFPINCVGSLAAWWAQITHRRICFLTRPRPPMTQYSSLRVRSVSCGPPWRVARCASMRNSDMQCFGNIIGCFSPYSRAVLCNRPSRRSSELSPLAWVSRPSGRWKAESVRSYSARSTPSKNGLSVRVGTSDVRLRATRKLLSGISPQVANSSFASSV